MRFADVTSKPARDKDQPRVPKDSAGGGEWTSAGGQGSFGAARPGRNASLAAGVQYVSDRLTADQGGDKTGSDGREPAAYIAADPQKGFGTLVGNGQCTDYVKSVVPDLPRSTSDWRPGMAVTKDDLDRIKPGTAIASFSPNGLYRNDRKENHAAIYLGPGKDKDGRDGIRVQDQWVGHPVKERVIGFGTHEPLAVNRAEEFSVIAGK